MILSFTPLQPRRRKSCYPLGPHAHASKTKATKIITVTAYRVKTPAPASSFHSLSLNRADVRIILITPNTIIHGTTITVKYRHISELPLLSERYAMTTTVTVRTPINMSNARVVRILTQYGAI